MAAQSQWTTLRRLQLFVAVVEAGGYTGAAENLGMKKPALIRREIQHLANDLFGDTASEPLFHRPVRDVTGPNETKLVLTAMGREIYALALKTYTAAADLHRQASQLGSSRPFLLGCYPAVFAKVVAPLLANEQDFRLHVDELPGHRARGGSILLERVSDESLDLAIVPTKTLAPPDLSSQVLYTWRLTAVFNARFAPGAPGSAVPWELLSERKLATSPQRHSSRNMLDERWPDSMGEPDVVYTSINTEALLAMVKNGGGDIVALLPSDSLNNYDPSHLSLHPIADPELVGRHAVYWRKDNAVRVQAVVQALADAAKASDEDDARRLISSVRGSSAGVAVTMSARPGLKRRLAG